MNNLRIAAFICVVLMTTTATFDSICSADDVNNDTVQADANSGYSASAATVAMGLVMGLGLSAACGFRIFVPLLGMSIANLAGHLSLSSDFQWIGTWPALLVFATAMILEIATYFIPWIDNVMDVAATPAAIVAGTIVTASQVGDVSPLLKWSLAVIAGGGVCGLVQTGTVAVRAVSSGTTGGFGNFIVATLELIASVVVTVLAIVLPIVSVLVVGWMGYKMMRKISRSKSTSLVKPQIAGA